MITDALLTFTGASGQTITSATTTTSTDHIRLDPLATGNTVRDIGTGEDLYLVVSLTTGSVTTVTSPTLTVNIVTDDNTGFSSALTIQTSGALSLPTTTAAATAGQRWILRLNPANFEEYVRLSFVTGGTITTASYTFDARIVMGVDAVRYYADAITIS